MAARKQTVFQVKKPSNFVRILLIILAILFFISFLLRFEVIAKAVSDVTGIEQDVIQNWAGYTLNFGGGIVCLIVATVFASVLLIAIPLVLVGLALLLSGSIQLWNSTKPNKIEGLKTLFT